MNNISLEEYHGPWGPGDPDANFRREVAAYSAVDPLPTLERMSRNLGIPVGALVRFILARWASSGSEGLMEIGPRVVLQMVDTVSRAEAEGKPEARLRAYEALSHIIRWLAVPLLDKDWRPGSTDTSDAERKRL